MILNAAKYLAFSVLNMVGVIQSNCISTLASVMGV